MRKYLNSNHKYLTCDSSGQIKYLKETVDMRDAPCMADIESSLMYFCNEISETNNIALTENVLMKYLVVTHGFIAMKC